MKNSYQKTAKTSSLYAVEKQYESFGALFENRYRTNPKAPVLTGRFIFTREMIDALYELCEQGNPVEVNLSAWKKTAQNTDQFYLTIKMALNPPSVGETGGGLDILRNF